MQTKVQIFFAIIAFAFVIAGCTKEENSIVPLPKSEKQKIQVTNDMLQFTDWKTFVETARELANKTNMQQTQWEQQFNYVSMKKAYNDFIEQNQTDLYTEKGSKKVLNRLPYAIYLKQTNKNEKSLELNIFDELYANIVNSNGYFAIGDTVCRVNKDYLTKTINGATKTCRMGIVNTSEKVMDPIDDGDGGGGGSYIPTILSPWPIEDEQEDRWNSFPRLRCKAQMIYYSDGGFFFKVKSEKSNNMGLTWLNYDVQFDIVQMSYSLSNGYKYESGQLPTSPLMSSLQYYFFIPRTVQIMNAYFEVNVIGYGTVYLKAEYN